jgi:putative ABC transport system substrate-binding protein
MSDESPSRSGQVAMILFRSALTRLRLERMSKADAMMKLAVFLLAGLVLPAQPAVPHPAVTAITVEGVDAYARALEGIRARLPNVLVLDSGNEAQMRASLSRGQPALAIAIGSAASAMLARLAPPNLTMISSVVLDSDLETGGSGSERFISSVTVDVPSEVLFREVARLFPGKTRIGVIRGPAQTDAYMKSLGQAVRQAGLSLDVLPCAHPRDLVDVFLKFRSRADLVWCPPNAQLYTSATLKPLLIASLTNRLPIIGFSEQFVQAGALFGGAADFADVGNQTATLALRILRKESVPQKQGPRKFHFTYNQRVARMLGVKASIPDGPGDELTIIR